MKRHTLLLNISIIIVLLGCDDDNLNLTSNSTSETDGIDGAWLISTSEVRDGGPGKDGIPALLNPDFVEPDEAGYLSDEELVIGFKWGNTVRAYPHDILDQHEIVNDQIDSHVFAISYCPLTGTGMAWNRKIGDTETTFGVSGLLYNSNLIPYDRATNSNWSQMRLDCVNGELQGTLAEMLPVIETSLGTLKKMYPNVKVISLITGHNRSYGYYPYGDYKINNKYLLFPVSGQDDRVPNKERVHGIIVDKDVLVFRFTGETYSSVLFQFEFSGSEFVVVGNEFDNFMVSFFSSTAEGNELSFSILENEYPLIMIDDEGNKWDVFGVAQEGPRKGEHLKPANSYMGYWFAWAAFYPTPTIFN